MHVLASVRVMAGLSGRRLGAGIAYAMTAIASLVLGVTYVLRGSFMPYHGEALGQAWETLAPEAQVLLLALMDVAGAGWLALALAVLVLLWWPFRAGALWARIALPILLGGYYALVLWATLSVLFATPAVPPWYGNAVALLATLAGVLLDAPWRREARTAAT
jgi:hypothetical protein